MDKIRSFFKLSNEDIILIVLALMSFSFGIWTNYRQLWLQDIGFEVSSISKILSASFVCSSIIIFFISFFSTRIKLKNVIMLSIVFRSVALLCLELFDMSSLIKTCMLLCIMCENIFAVAFYPFLASVNKSNETYKKHVLINYFAKDSAVVFCGLMLGVTLGKVVFSYNTCLFLTLMFTISSAIILLLYDENEVLKKKNILPFRKAFKNLFKSKNTNYYLLGQFISETAYGIVFGMIMILLTTYLKFDVSHASIIIIVCNILGTIVSSILSKYSDKWSSALCTIIKYGSRILMYVLAFLSGSATMFILAIIVAYISTKILDDKVNGVFIREIKTDSQFLFGNVRYFILCLADGFGIFLGGILLEISMKYIFLVAALITIIATLVYTLLCKSKE